MWVGAVGRISMIIQNSCRQVKLDSLTRCAADSYDSALEDKYPMLDSESEASLGSFLPRVVPPTVPMIFNLRYGADSTLRLDIPPDALVAHCDAPRGEPLARVADALDRALGEPIEFPPLARAVVPGDKVVLALADMVPQAATIVAGTVAALLSAGVSFEDITPVRAGDDALAAEPLGQLSTEVRAAITSQTHDPSDRRALGHLGPSQAGEPIYINRAIHDADLVLLIGCLRLGESLGYYGFPGGVFPTFSDAASLARYRLGKSTGPRKRERLLKAAEEIHRLLGVQFTIQVVPGVGGAVLDVLAGEMSAVLRAGARRSSEAWSYDVPERASLIVATIEGDAAQQTWENVARALAAASHALRDDGAVVVCCELSGELGPAMQLVAGADDLDAALAAIGKRAPSDARAAAEVVRALQRGQVYLLSRLDEDLVEGLGMVPLPADGVARLAERYDSCILLENAHCAVARAGDQRLDVPAIARSKSPR